MRSLTYSTACFSVLLILCLMFAPSRRVTGDRMATAAPHEVVIPEASTLETPKDFAELCRTQPLDAIAESIRAFKEGGIEGYSCTFVKRERIGDTLHPQETTACDVRERPFAVKLRWQDGKRRADAIMFVANENDDRLLIIPSGDLEKRLLKLKGTPWVKRPIDGADAKGASRYPINQFGIYKTSVQVYQAWKAAREQGALNVEYRGIEKVALLNQRTCHVLVRTCVPPDEDGADKVTIYIDTETKLQLGSSLYANNELLGHYFYQNVQFNPLFATEHFKAERFQ